MKIFTRICDIHTNSENDIISNEFYIKYISTFKGENKYYWIWETDDTYYFSKNYKINYINNKSYAHVWLYAHNNSHIEVINVEIFPLNFNSKNWKNRLSNIVHKKMENNAYKKDFSYVFDNIIIKNINHKMLSVGAL